MRVAVLFLAVLGATAVASSLRAQALPPSGAGVSNSVNQSFQVQNQLRGLQQQQNFDANTNRLQNQTNQMYNAPRNYGPVYLPRRSGGASAGGVVGRTGGGGRPERER